MSSLFYPARSCFQTRKIWYRALSVVVIAELLFMLATASGGETRQPDLQKDVLARKIVLSAS